MPRAKRDLPWIDTRDGVYYAFWSVTHVGPTGRKRATTERLSLRTRNPHEAQTRFAAFLTEGRDIFRPEPQSGGSPRLSVRRMLDDYWREHVNAVDDRGRPRVADPERQEDIITHLKAFFGDDHVTSIDIPKCRSYTAARRSGAIGGGKRRKKWPASDSTIRRELVVLHAAVEHAIKWKRLTGVTVDQMPTFEYPADRREVEEGGEAPWLTHDQLTVLRASATGRLADFIDIAYYTASRRNAVETLQWPQVQLAEGKIHLAKPGERRTKKRRPIVPIDRELRPTLERLAREKTNEWVLGSPASLYRPFVALCADIGIEASPHILRHTRATHLLQDGVSIYDVARLLGDTVQTVERVYGHHSTEYLAKAINRRRKTDAQDREAA